MTTFFWSSGRLGWAFFGIFVFSILLLLFADLAWRLKRVSRGRFVSTTIAIWVASICATLALYWLVR